MQFLKNKANKMRHLNLFETFSAELIEEKKKEKKWIKKAIKDPGALHRALGFPEDETIPMETIDSEIDKLHKKREEVGDLTKKESKMLKRLNLAKTLKSKINK